MALIRLQSGNLPTGSVLQVKYAEVNRTQNGQYISSQTFGDLNGYSISITPTSTNSKIFISYGIHAFEGPSGGSWVSAFRTQLMRDSTKIYPTTNSDYDGGTYGPTSTYSMKKFESSYLDAPNTTSQITYKVQARSRDGNSTAFNVYANGHMVVMEIAG